MINSHNYFPCYALQSYENETHDMIENKINHIWEFNDLHNWYKIISVQSLDDWNILLWCAFSLSNECNYKIRVMHKSNYINIEIKSK